MDRPIVRDVKGCFSTFVPFDTLLAGAGTPSPWNTQRMQREQDAVIVFVQPTSQDEHLQWRMCYRDIQMCSETGALVRAHHREKDPTLRADQS